MLHKAVGNMYDWISSTWNPIKGKCVRHDCIYCYMKRFPQKPVRLDEKTLKEDLGKNNIIFVGSSCDVFAKDIPDNWISRVLEHCAAYPENQYIFQSTCTSFKTGIAFDFHGIGLIHYDHSDCCGSRFIDQGRSTVDPCISDSTYSGFLFWIHYSEKSISSSGTRQPYHLFCSRINQWWIGISAVRFDA